MKVVVAKSAGACYGVDRALRIAHEAAQSEQRVQTLGPLIHNPQVISELEHLGAPAVAAIEDLDCDKVVIRSHGATPETYDKIEAAGIEVVDATCPHVQRAQRCALELAEQGYTVLVVGEAGHPEVEGIAAWASRGGCEPIIISDPNDLPTVIVDPTGVVVQTTQQRALFDAVIDALRTRGLDPVVHDTICSATDKRQRAAKELAQEVDVMVVIGGKNSSNTTRLYEICSEWAPRAVHIETVDELDRALFEGAKTVGITAGASTPSAQIEPVVDLLQSW